MGSKIAKQSPEFDPRNYGYAKLSALVTATGLFESVLKKHGGNDQKIVYICEKKTDNHTD